MLPKESTSSRMQTSEVDVDSAQSGAFEHLLPDASFLLYGVFAQSGFDLEITNPDGIAHVVPDYFSFPTPPNLMIESGAGLSPAMVKSLFPRAFGQDVLFAGPAPSGSALVEIGSVKLVVGTVTVRHADGSQETISKGAILYQGDVLVTGAGSFIKAEMRDGTKFQLGQNGEAALDKYEFDEAADVGRFEATVRVGGFYYKSGKIGELPSASAQAHTQLNTPTSIIGVRGSELEGVVDQSGETVVVHRSGVLEITDINGENAVTLDTPGNTAVVVLNGQPAFTTEPSQQTQQALQQSLPPPDGSTAEDEAVESDAEEEVVEEAVAEAEEAVEESAEEEVVEEVVEEVAEEVEEVEEAELDESDDPEEEAEENSDEEDLDSLGVDESSVESQSDVESAEDVASNEGEGEAVETGDDEALSTFTNPDTSVDSATDDVDTTLETLQSQDSNVEGQDSGELQTLGATSSNVEESVVEVEDVAAEEPQEVIAPDNPPQALADEIAVVAGNAIDVTDQLLGNDSDPDFGQVLAIVSVNSTRPDAVTLADGRVQFQPDESLLQSLGAGESTTETFSYTLESGDSSADADVVIVYQGRNDAPIANNDVAETDEDAPLLLTVISNDSDPDLADTLVITSIDSSTALGAITIAEDGQSLLYEPSQSLSEGSIDDVFSYTISDGNTTATATVTVTVTGLNDPPVLVSDPTGFTLELIPEAGEISIPLDAIFADSDLGSTLTVLALDTELTRGSVRIGSVLYDPGDAFDYLKEGEIGIEQFGITVQDEFGQTGQGVFSFQIEGVNDAPVAVGNTSSVLENGSIDLGASSSVLGDDTDIDGDALTISSIRTGDIAATNGAQGAVGSILAGTYGVLTLNEDGQYSYATTASAVDGLAAGVTVVDVFTYTITDGAESTSAELLITVTGVNDAPVAVGNTSSVLENGSIDLAAASSVLGDDTDIDGDALTISSIRTGDIAATNGAQGAVGSILAGTYGVLTLNEDGQYSYATTASAVDGLAAGVTVVDVFTYTITDGAESTSAELLITVTGVNDAPVAVGNTSSVLENGSIDLAAASSVLGDDTDIDGDALTISSIRTGDIAATNGAQGAVGSILAGTYGVLTLNEDGQYSYATTASAVDGLAAGVTVVDVFTYTITDGAESTSAELLITVTGVNDAPVAVGNTSSVLENGSIDLAAASSVLGDDTDIDGDALTISSIRTGDIAATNGAQGAVGSILAGTYGVLTLNEDGQYSYATTASAVDGLAAGVTVVDVFTYTITDGAESTSAELLITVTGVNDAPVAVGNTSSVLENGSIDLAAASSVLGDDTDIDGDALTISSIRTGDIAATNGAQGAVGSILAGTYGVLTLNEDGQYSYATTASAVDGLAAGVTVVDVFTYTITDGAESTSAELLITVTGVNDAPVAVGNTSSVLENGSIDLAAASSVLGDDTDIDGDALTISSIRTGDIAATNGAQGAVGSILAGTYGVLTLNEDGQYSYATTASAVDGLAAGVTVVDVFTYTITDGAESTSAELLITVTGVNDAPVAVGNTSSVLENGSIDLAAASSVLGDDTDIDGDALTISSIRTGDIAATNGAQGAVGSILAGTYGVLTLNEDGQYSYATTASAVDGLAAGVTVVDVFTYTITDGAESTSAELLITVTGVNDAPVALGNTNSVPENGEIELVVDQSLLLDDTDVDGGALLVTGIRAGALDDPGTSGSIGAPFSGAYGTLTVNANGSYSYAANTASSVATDEVVEDVFTYTVSDGSLSSSAELRIEVTGVSDGPLAIGINDALLENDEIERVVDTGLLSNQIEGDTLIIAGIRIGTLLESGIEGAIGEPLVGIYGTLTLNQNGSYSYLANAADSLSADEVVEDVFTYTVSDGSLTSSAELRFTVTGLNDRPIAANNQDAVLENGTLESAADKNLLLDDFDIDGDTLSVSALRSGSIASTGSSGTLGESLTGLYGSLTLDSDGSYRYTANAAEALALGEEVEDVFSYTVSDGTSSSSAELRITVTGVNDLPVAVDNVDTVPEDGEIASVVDKSLLSNDEDVDGDVLSVTAIRVGALDEGGASGTIGVALTGAYGTLTLNSNGSYSYVANAADSLAADIVVEDVFAYTVSDGTATSIAELRITVTGANDGPVAVNNTDAVFENGEIALDAGKSLLLNDADIDSDTLTVVAVHSGTSTNVGTTGAVGTGLDGDYGTLTLDADGVYSYAANASATEALAAGTVVEDVFTYTVSDGLLESSAEIRISVTGVNDAPVAVADQVNAIQGQSAVDINVLINDQDVDGDALSLTLVGASAGGTVIVNEDQTLSYTPLPSFSGEELITYSVSDGKGGSATVQLAVVVSASEMGPVALNDVASIEEDTPLLNFDVLANDSAPVGETLTLTSATSESAATITINEDGTLSYQGPSDFYGADVVSYSIQDSQGRVSQAAVEITITPVNDDPIASSDVDAIAENGLIALEEDKSLLSDDLDVDGDTLAVSAIRAGALSEQGANGTVGESLVGAYGTLTLNANGNYSYAANAGAVEDLSAGTVVEDVFTYTVSDGALSSSAELRISVTGVNDAPTAVSNVEAVAEDELIADKNLLINDSDIDGDALSVSAVRSGALTATGTTGTIGSALSGAYGTLTLNANGSYSYAANMADSLSAGEIAEDVFSYTVSDGGLSSSAELRVSVTGVNDAPTAVSNIETVVENDALVDKSLLSDDADIDGDSLSVLAVRAGDLSETGTSGTIGETLAGTYGALTLAADGAYNYVANASAVEALAAGATVEDVFTYTVSDGSLTSSAELRVTVIGANDRPVAVSNADSVVENGVISEVAGINLLLNDADIDGDTLVVSAVRAGDITQIGTSGTIGVGLTGAYGTLILNADGTYRYTANSNAVEALAAGTVDEDVFTYSVSDGALTASAELRISVTGVNDPADLSVTALDASVTRNALFDGSASGQITLTDADLGEASIASATAFFGVVTVAEDGGWVYDLDDTNDAVLALDESLAETLVDTITFTSIDGSEASLDVSIFTANLPATLTLTLDNPSGLALTAGDLVNQTITGQITVTDNEGAILLPITANYGDVTQVGDEWTYSLQNESISVQGLDEGEVITDTIVFLTDDARDLNADTVILDVSGSIEGRQTLTVTISGVNDAPVVTLAAIETDQFVDEIMVGSAEGVLRFAIDPDNADGSVTDTLTVVGARQGSLSSSTSVIAVNQLVLGSYGTLTVQTDGSYSYSADSGLQDLALEDTDLIEDVFTVQVSDGNETVEAELRFNIDNAAPVAVNGARTHQVVTTGSSGLLVNYADFDDLTITLSQADALPSGFVVTTPSSAIGRDLSVTGSADKLPESSVFFGSLTSVVGDYRLISSVSDGDNPVTSDQFILSVRSPTILSSIDQVYEFVSGESDYAAVYLDPAENSGILSVYAWAPSEAGDRLAVFGNTSISVYSETGTNLTLEGAALVDLNSSPGADVLTIRGSVAGLNFAGISALDTLVNQSLILASPGANQFQLQNEGIVQLTSSGVGDRYSFEDASGNPITSPVVGIAQSASVSFGDTVQTVGGQLLLTPDNQPAAPYLVLASLTTDGIVEITGYNQVSISQPAELEVSATSGNPLSGSLIQSAAGTISISSGGRITTETLLNSGTITLTNNNYDGLISGGAGSAGHLAVTGTYTESGVLISQVSDSFYIPASDLNELSVVDMVLTGEIRANADLLFSNVSQSLDWRAGTITLAPNADLIIAGGSVILSAESTIIGYGDLMFGQASGSVESDSTIFIDGAVSTAQFDSGFNFDSSRVTIAALTNAAADTLTIANLDQWTLDNEVVNTNLQIAGTFEVNGGRSALNGSTSIATSGVIRLNESLGVDTNLIVSQTLTNLGNIEINLDPLASGELVYSPSISISGGSYSAAAGVITIDTSAAHGLATGDVIRMRYAFPEGYNYTGEVTVTSTTSFSFAAASDPGAFQSGGSIDGFSTSLILSGGFTNSGSLVVQGTKLESADQSLYSDARVLIDGDITNSAGGALIFREGDIILEGNLSNAGILEIDGATSAGSTSYSGANVTLDGDLILASTSNLQLEVTTSSEYYYVNGLYLEAGGVVRGGDADAFNLGGLMLNFNDSSLGNNFSGQDSNTLFLFYDNAISGANFNTLTTDLAAGYEAEVQATVSSSDSSVQTISVVVSDDMEFESSASGRFGDGSIVWAREALLADVASAAWSAGVATLVTSAAHGLTDGQTVNIYGAGSGGYSYYGVISVIDSHTITYIASDPGPDPGDLQIEDYYASNVAVESADWSSIDTTVTVVTDRNHGLVTGQLVDIFGNSPSSFDIYYQTVTVIDATTFTYASDNDPGTWTSGGTILTQSPTINDDVRIAHALTVDAGETVSLNSFSLETSTVYGTSTTTTTVGTLSLEGDFDATAETTTLNVADQSTVAYGSSLYVGSA